MSRCPECLGEIKEFTYRVTKGIEKYIKCINCDFNTKETTEIRIDELIYPGINSGVLHN